MDWNRVKDQFLEGVRRARRGARERRRRTKPIRTLLDVVQRARDEIDARADRNRSAGTGRGRGSGSPKPGGQRE